MRRFFAVFAAALVVAGAAVAAVARQKSDPPRPTMASLTPAYVQAARYWSARGLVPARLSPPTTASLMNAYVQAAAVWHH